MFPIKAPSNKLLAEASVCSLQPSSGCLKDVKFAKFKLLPFSKMEKYIILGKLKTARLTMSANTMIRCPLYILNTREGQTLLNKESIK